MPDDALWCVSARSSDHSADRRAEIGQCLAEQARPGRSVLLVTCERVELYASTSAPPHPGGARLLAGQAAARHLFRVAAGLESSVAGENEILGQVRHAFAEAGRRARLEGGLSRLFQAAIATGRRCRAGREPSGSSLAVVAARELLARLAPGSAPVLVAGAGYMGAAIASLLAAERLELLVASRTFERACAVASRVGATALPLDAAARLGPQTRGVAVALGGPWTAAFEGRLPAVVDVSSPPALGAAVSRDYVGIDALLALGAAGRRDGYVGRAERLVEADVAAYLEGSRRRLARVAV